MLKLGSSLYKEFPTKARVLQVLRLKLRIKSARVWVKLNARWLAGTQRAGKRSQSCKYFQIKESWWVFSFNYLATALQQETRQRRRSRAGAAAMNTCRGKKEQKEKEKKKLHLCTEIIPHKKFWGVKTERKAIPHLHLFLEGAGGGSLHGLLVGHRCSSCRCCCCCSVRWTADGDAAVRWRQKKKKCWEGEQQPAGDRAQQGFPPGPKEHKPKPPLHPSPAWRHDPVVCHQQGSVWIGM